MNIKINEDYKKLVPKPSKEDYDALVKSLIDEGLQNPIIINSSGEILDGHTRYSICSKYNIPIKREIKRFSNKLEEKIYVISSNLNRRHINKAQRARLALAYLELLQQLKKQEAEQKYETNKSTKIEENNTISEEKTDTEKTKTIQGIGKATDAISDIAKKFNIGSGTLKRAKIIQNKINQLPEVEELWKKTETGEETIDGVYQKVKEIERQTAQPIITNNYIISKIGEALNILPNNFFDSALINLQDNKDVFYMMWLPLIFNKLKINSCSRVYIFTDIYNNYKLYTEMYKYKFELKNTLIYLHDYNTEREQNKYKQSYKLIYYFSNEDSSDINKYENNIELKDFIRTRYQYQEIPEDVLEFIIKSGLSGSNNNLSIFDNGYLSYKCAQYNIKSISINESIDEQYKLRKIESIDEVLLQL
jgi:hypothetical protein